MREVAAARGDVKALCTSWGRLKWVEGVLCVSWVHPWGGQLARLRYIIPLVLQPGILEHYHSSLLAGHFVVERTTERLRNSVFYWPRQADSVRDFVRRCDTCTLSKARHRTHRAPMESFAATEPMERGMIDVMGPLPETPRGNKYIMVFMDQFTKWVEVWATPDHQAKTLAPVLVQQVFMRLGLPQILHSDKGREFESRLFAELCRELVRSAADDPEDLPEWREIARGAEGPMADDSAPSISTADRGSLQPEVPRDTLGPPGSQPDGSSVQAPEPELTDPVDSQHTRAGRVVRLPPRFEP